MPLNSVGTCDILETFAESQVKLFCIKFNKNSWSKNLELYTL